MIIDCIMASYETDALEVRDAELADVVDLRIIVVGKTDFRGSEALPFMYNAAAAKTETHVFPVDLGDGSPWDREFRLRDVSLSAARHFIGDGHTYIVSDGDEIPHPLAIADATITQWSGILKTDLRQWWMDWRAPDNWQLERQPLIGSADYFDRQGGASQARINQAGVVFKGTGWHLSTLGDAALARRKLQTFSHEEYDTPQHTDPDRLEDLRAAGLDILGRFPLAHTTLLPSCAEQFPHLLRH